MVIGYGLLVGLHSLEAEPDAGWRGYEALWGFSITIQNSLSWVSLESSIPMGISY
jgi:hypothetical protein